MEALMPDPAYTDEEAVREAEAVRVARARRDAALTPSERLERLHELCRQLAHLKPVDR